MTTCPVHIHALNQSFAEKKVLDQLHLDIPAGSVTGLLGRNGAGKSTLLECLLGLRDFQSGSIQLFGEELNCLSRESKAKIGYVPQTTEIFGWLNARQLFAYFRSMYPRWNQEKADQLLRRWELPENLMISKMSAGQKQRLSIIRALAHEPELLILDEPVSSLDPAGRRDFLRELIDLTDRQTTIVFSTHILSDLERIAMDVAVLNHGKIILQQPLDTLMDNSLQITIASDRLTSLPEMQAFRQQAGRDGYTRILAQFALADLAQLQARSDLRAEKLSLEDLFIELTQ